MASANDEIVELMKKAGISSDGKTVLYDGKPASVSMSVSPSASST
jgi:DNA-directed RNA polymerase beta subunit